MFRAFLLALLLLTIAGSAHAEPDSVVLVPTQGEEAWLAGERRIEAELQWLHLKVIKLPPRVRSDHELPRHAAAFGAVASVQVLRDGEDGLIRVWLARGEHRTGGYRHVRVNLRGPEVVTNAVVPIVELIFQYATPMPELARSSKGSKRRRTERKGSKTGAETEKGPVRLTPERYGAPVVGPPVRYHLRSEMTHALRLGVGPWFSGGQSTPGINVSLGARLHYWKLLSVEPELLAHVVTHRVQTREAQLDEDLQGVREPQFGELPLLGARVHVLFEPWPRSNVSVGLGPGFGVLWVLPQLPERDADSALSMLLSGRVQMASALAPYLDVLFIATISGDLGSTASYGLSPGDDKLFRPAVDAQLAVDWHWN